METKVTREVAVLAKEKGFKERTVSFYRADGRFVAKDKEHIPDDWDWNHSFIGRVSVPTQSQLQKWLREKHNIHMFTRVYRDSVKDETTFACDVIRLLSDGRVVKSPRLETYEDALGYALNEGLKLIEE